MRVKNDRRMATQKALAQLEAAGFSRVQAAAIIAGIDLKHAQLAKKSDLTLLKWMLGFNLSLTAAILFKLL